MFPDQFETARLLLRPIEPGDAVAIFEGYAQDPAVTRYLAWCPHLSIADTQAYIASCLGYGIHTFDWTADWAARAKPAAMAANCAHPARMVLGPGGL